MNFFSSAKKVEKQDLSPLLDFDKDTEYTPDVATLERRTHWLLFVPDQMMSRHHSNVKLGSSVKMLEALTEDNFSFWKQRRGDFTQAIPLGEAFKTVPFNPIKGEVFLVKSQKFFELDTERRNGVEFERKRIKLKVPYRRVSSKDFFIKEKDKYEWALANTPYHEGQLNAWMYVGISNYWSPLLDGGYMFTPVKSFIPHNKRLTQYYYFTIGEYDQTIREPRTVFRMRQLRR